MTAHPLRDAAYAAALKVMFQVSPERIHDWLNTGLDVLQKAPGAITALAGTLPVTDPVLEQEVFGVKFPRPLGLAAGFDKTAHAADAWSPLGFGYAELGTVTAKAQPGNPQPRLFRVPADRGIINRMGFNNPGADVVKKHLANRKRTGDVIGINIGKTKVTPLAEAEADYRYSAQRLAPLADFLVVNVSSPNTPGLRDLQAVESLRPILAGVREETDKPVLVKIAPDLSDDDVISVAELAGEVGLAGIVATNTTISRAGLKTPAQTIADIGAGGLSGAPVAARSLEVLELLNAVVGTELVLVSVGGIETPAQAWERIGAGASLLQGYTPLIYGGPDWIRDIHLGLAAQVKAHGLNNLSEAVGEHLPWIAP
ncbi:quinone-dependent dihydroorotate dehydrogenase [Corynebacterium ulceribovis]|uniref:quinone-dependent dihydroorotate dehydrogenase n=1 Tax=Corynebacterium ulceribovis TaxID=487732 RepID=UPI00037FF457|nr:quinone-dependent dihydroorotate dehydrogenase [Corynebacterium ulceribovis]